MLPPYVGATAANPTVVSPYRTTPMGLVDRFAVSPERVALLQGFFAFRESLRSKGIVSGFQWIDGSFVEDIEGTQSRSPGDIDVITLLKRPGSIQTEADWDAFVLSLSGTLISPAYTKSQFGCDAYYVDLSISPEDLIAQANYWFGLFSHQRVTRRWKGLVEVGLDDNDADAASELARRAV